MQAHPIYAVSNSELNSKTHCLRMWNLGSNNRRNLSSKKPNDKLWLGTGVHKSLEDWCLYGGDLPIVEAFDRWANKKLSEIREAVGSKLSDAYAEDLRDAKTLGQEMVKHYGTWARAHDDFNVIMREVEFEVPIPNTEVILGYRYDSSSAISWLPWVEDLYGDPIKNPEFITRYVGPGLISEMPVKDGAERLKIVVPGLFVGKMDGLTTDKKKHTDYWILETKTRAGAFKEEYLLLDRQTARYMWAIATLIANGVFEPGIPKTARLRGVIYNILVKKVPRIPKLLKSGRGLSKNQSILTTEAVYRQAIEDHGFDPRDYEDILTHLRNKGNRFFIRNRVIRGTDELALVGDILSAEFRDIQRYDSEPLNISNTNLYPNPTEDCLWRCAFRGVCVVANYGGDAESIIDLEYTQSKPRGDVYAHPYKYGINRND